MSQTIIGCKLPQGLTFKGSNGQDITLNGMNTAMIEGGYGLTYLDENEAALFFATHEDFHPVLSNAIFTHHTDQIGDIISMGDELVEEKTGLEGLNPDKPSPGLKPEDKQSLSDKALALKPPVRAPKAAADKVAAQTLAASKSGRGKK